MTNLYAGSSPDFNDAAFEPHSAYMFEENSNMDQLQRELDLPYDGSSMFINTQQARSAMMHWGDQMDMSSIGQDFQPQDMPPQGFSYNHNNEEPSPTTSWHAPGASMLQAQSSTSGSRGGGVTQRYGQVTPVTSQSRSPASGDDAQQQKSWQSRQTAQSNAKSERARNAANHRHSRSKQARESSRKSKNTSANHGDDAEEEDTKPRDAGKEYREKNRQAAAKCRRKKKDSTEILEASARSGKEQNAQLKATIRWLRDQRSDLMTKALAHDGCACTDIHRYNAEQARQAVRGQGSMQDMQDMQAMQSYNALHAMQSPVEGQMATTEMPQMSLCPMSRGQSFSAGMNPEIAIQHFGHARIDSKQDHIMRDPSSLQLDDHEFAFGPTLGDSPENGSNGEYQ